MPFDFAKYDAKCAAMSAEELQREWEHYTRLISGSATSTAVSGLAMPFTLGVSGIGVGLASMSIHNARKKREIIDRHLGQRGALHNTRKRDVFAPICVSGTVGIVTLGVGAVAADAITAQATEHAFTTIAENELAVKVTTHLALDAAVMAGEEEHMKNKKTQEAAKTVRKVPSQVKETATQYAPSAVELQPPEKPPRPSSYTPSSYVDASIDDDLQSQFKGLNVSAPEAEIPRPVTPAPPYAPNPIFLANDTGKPTDTTTIYLPPLPPRANKMYQASVHGDTRPAPAEPYAGYFPPPPPVGNYPSATFVTANAAHPAGQFVILPPTPCSFSSSPMPTDHRRASSSSNSYFPHAVPTATGLLTPLSPPSTNNRHSVGPDACYFQVPHSEQQYNPTPPVYVNSTVDSRNSQYYFPSPGPVLSTGPPTTAYTSPDHSYFATIYNSPRPALQKSASPPMYFAPPPTSR